MSSKKRVSIWAGLTKRERKGANAFIKKAEKDMLRRMKIIKKVTIICIAFILAARLGYASQLQDSIVKAAVEEIGNGEAGRNNYGEDIKKYMRGVEGQSWCAGFVSYVLNKSGVRDLGYNMSARAIYNKGKEMGWEIQSPCPGDLVCFWRGSKNSWKGHVGVIKEVEGNYIISIEGNKGKYPAKVKCIEYVKNNVPKLLGYIRIGGEL